MVYRTSSHVVWQCQFHLVWATKYRRPLLADAAVVDIIKACAAEVAAEHDAEIIALEAEPDHIHVLASVPPQLGPVRFAQRVKGRSSREVREAFPKVKSKAPSLWTRSLFVATTGGASIETVRAYVENQPLRVH